MCRTMASREGFGRIANVKRRRKRLDWLVSGIGALFRGVGRLAAAMLDACWIAGQIPHAPPDFHEAVHTDASHTTPRGASAAGPPSAAAIASEDKPET